MAHTPGPWTWDEYGDIVDEDGTTIASVQDHGNINTIVKTGESFSHADANLIAAAPDLLAALEGLLDNYKQNKAQGLGISPIMKARKAIKKAKGQSTVESES